MRGMGSIRRTRIVAIIVGDHTRSNENDDSTPMVCLLCMLHLCAPGVYSLAECERQGWSYRISVDMSVRSFSRVEFQKGFAARAADPYTTALLKNHPAAAANTPAKDIHDGRGVGFQLRAPATKHFMARAPQRHVYVLRKLSADQPLARSNFKTT